jgi:predicted lipoprotein with Yx(FWY)xxD motif
MKRKYITSVGLTVAIVIGAVAVFAGGGSAKTSRPPVAGGSAVSVRHTSLGTTLVDANGRTLYLFVADKTNVSTLSASGRAVWPPFTAVGTVKAKGGAQAAKLGTTSGPAGSKQVTYAGHPLYYFVGDRTPGSTRGQRLNEFGALWYVLAPSGSAITSAAPSKPAPVASTPTSNYGY